MATWTNFCRTQQGKALDMKLISKEQSLRLTKAIAGAGRIDSAQLVSLVQQPEPKQQLVLLDKETNTDAAEITLPVLLTNKGLTESYHMQTLGIYAQDPDLGEILYMVSQTLAEEGEEIPTEAQQPAFSIQWNLCIKVSDTENVTVEVPQAGVLTELAADRRYAKAADFAELAESVAGKAEKSAVVLGVVRAQSWDQTDKTYSFEPEYPAGSYDLAVEPDSSCSEEQLEAWGSAKVVGSVSANVLKAFGDVPAVDVPVIMEVKRK